MKVAIDIDHTILCYDDLLKEAANLENVEDPFSNKEELKKIIEEKYDWPQKWINIQGHLYGKLIHKAPLKNGAYDCLNELKEEITIELVSHKSLKSLCGRYELQAEAVKRLTDLGVTELIKDIKFFETKREKLDYLNKSSFNIVIDDLSEIINKTNILIPILYSPLHSSPFIHTNDWTLIRALLKSLKYINVESVLKLKKISKQTIKMNLNENNKNIFLKYFIDEERSRRERYIYHWQYPEFIMYENENVLITKDLNLTPVEIIEKKDIHGLVKEIKRYRGIDLNLKAIDGISHFEDLEANLNRRLEYLNSNNKNLLKLDFIKKFILKNLNKSLGIKTENLLPDFFKGNMARNSKNEIVFMDFESFGKDDPARMFLNFCHHLGHKYTFDEIDILKEAFILAFNDEKLFDRVEKLYNYVAFDWLLILYKWNKEKFEEELNKMHKKIIIGDKIISPQKEVYDHIFG